MRVRVLKAFKKVEQYRPRLVMPGEVLTGEDAEIALSRGCGEVIEELQEKVAPKPLNKAAFDTRKTKR